ncbi:hypothetical protein [Psychrobacillus insolitus]|nr:hypothetical protein [Psychrobacillus insolitus]
MNGFDQTIVQFTLERPINVEAGYDVVLFEPFTYRVFYRKIDGGI